MVLVPDSQMPALLGAQANRRQDLRGLESGRRPVMSIPVVTVGQAQEMTWSAAWNGCMDRSPSSGDATDLTELLAACQSGLARAAVVADGSEGLTASLVDRLGAVGVADHRPHRQPTEAARLRGTRGSVCTAGVEPADLAGRIAEAVAELTGSDARHPGTSWTGRSQVPALRRRARERPAASREPSASGTCHRGVGSGRLSRTDHRRRQHRRRTRREGKSVLLVDADSYGASIAAVLGLLDESAGLAQACRLADQGVLDAEALRRVASTGAHQPRDLPGPHRHHPRGPLDGTARVSPVHCPGTRPAAVSPTWWSWTPGSAWKRTKSSASTPWLRAGTRPPCAAGTGGHCLRRWSRRRRGRAAAGPRSYRAGSGGAPGLPGGGDEQGPGVGCGACAGTAVARRLGAVRTARRLLGCLPAGRPRRSRRGAARRLAAAGSGARVDAAAEPSRNWFVHLPSENAKSSVFSSTARRR